MSTSGYTSSSSEDELLDDNNNVAVYDQSGEKVNLEANKKKAKVVPVIRGRRGDYYFYNFLINFNIVFFFIILFKITF